MGDNKHILSVRLALRGVFGDINTPVQVIVEDMQFVNYKLEEEQYFFSDIKREGIVLYNTCNYTLADAKLLSATRRREIAEEDFEQWNTLAVDAFDIYRTTREQSKLNWAAFHLQQAVEMYYTTIEMVFAHYNCTYGNK